MLLDSNRSFHGESTDYPIYISDAQSVRSFSAIFFSSGLGISQFVSRPISDGYFDKRHCPSMHL